MAGFANYACCTMALSNLYLVSYVDRPKYLQQSPRHNNSGSVCAFVIPYVDGTADMRLQQLLHELYMEHPELQAYIPEKPLVSFKKSRNLGSRLPGSRWSITSSQAVGCLAIAFVVVRLMS